MKPAHSTTIVTSAAIRLLFTAMRRLFPCPDLVSVAHIHNGQGLKAEDREAHGTEDVFSSGGRVGSHTERMHSGPFVVIGRKGSAAKITYAPNGGWVTDTAYFATPREPVILDCKYLFYALKSLDFSDDIISTAIPGINRTAIYAHSIPHPTLDIQLAVVQFLDAIERTSEGSELPVIARTDIGARACCCADRGASKRDIRGLPTPRSSIFRDGCALDLSITGGIPAKSSS